MLEPYGLERVLRRALEPYGLERALEPYGLERALNRLPLNRLPFDLALYRVFGYKDPYLVLFMSLVNKKMLSEKNMCM